MQALHDDDDHAHLLVHFPGEESLLQPAIDLAQGSGAVDIPWIDWIIDQQEVSMEAANVPFAADAVPIPPFSRFVISLRVLIVPKLDRREKALV